MTMVETASASRQFEAALVEAFPVRPVALHIGDLPTGLVIIDEVNGFATTGAGNLAPRAENPQVEEMVRETDRLARAFTNRGRPILAFLDSHEPGKPEPPYPPHCEIGTGEEELVARLRWLADDAHSTLIDKDCINGFIGAIAADGRNRFVDWVMEHQLRALLVVGICTDVCVMDFVLTALSARNHGLMPGLRDIVVQAPGCATYDLPREVAEQSGLGPTAAHPQAATHHLGLYFMASRGAQIVDQVSFAD
jgi:nicotinamidase-related amidase